MIKRAIKPDIKKEGNEKTREREREREILTHHFQWLLRPEILTLWPSIWAASQPENTNIKIYETSTRSRVKQRRKWLDSELRRNISMTDIWRHRNGHHYHLKEYRTLCRHNVSHRLAWEAGDISQRHYSFCREMTSVVRAHKHGISALVPQSSFRGKIIGGVAKWRLFSQATADKWRG